MSTEPFDDANVAIAVIGMSGAYPGARDLNRFWENLRDGVESITFFTDEEHEIPSWAPGAGSWVKARGVLEDPELFDAGFFGYTPAEATAMDPQHRLFLERGWEAIEVAGYDPESYHGSIGVFGGVSSNTYTLASLFANPTSTGLVLTDKDFLATRLSYRLNLRGPSVVVQTACSTSLVAVSLACQSLLNYQCDIALAGGSSICVPLKSGYPYQLSGPMSPDGHCRAFDAEGRGFVPGHGVGVVALKRLS
jgi:acyl transferase domain-containing protein